MDRYEASKIWAEAYKQGADDERQAMEWEIPEYPRAARQNPYGDPEIPRSIPEEDTMPTNRCKLHAEPNCTHERCAHEYKETHADRT